jgi:hypothetical protein
MMDLIGRSRPPTTSAMKDGHTTICTHMGGASFTSTSRAPTQVTIDSGRMMKNAGPSPVSWPAKDSPQTVQAGAILR